MGALYDISYPTSLSYAGFAWEFLRRNPNYRIAYERSRASAHLPHKISSGGSYIRLKAPSKAAEKWGLQSFANPDLDYLKAHVFWSHKVFNQWLPIKFGLEKASNLSEKSIRFSDILCTRHHLITQDGQRETVLKSSNFWLQLHGQPPSPTKENGRIVIRIDVLLAERKMKAKDLADALGLTDAQLSKIRNGHMKGIKFETLDRLCNILECEPGDLLKQKR